MAARPGGLGRPSRHISDGILGATIIAGLHRPISNLRASALRLNIRKATDTPTLAEFQATVADP